MAGNFIQRSRHGTVFYFRRRVPLDLRESFGKLQIYVSLRTEKRREATIRARSLAAVTDRLFDDLRKMPRRSNSSSRTDYSLVVQFDEETGRRKSLTITDVKPGEGEEVAALVNRVSGEHAAPSIATPTIAEATSEVMASDVKGRTKVEYERAFAHLAEFFGKDTRLGEIQQQAFAKFAAAVKSEASWSDKTKNTRIGNAARLFNFYAGTNPAVPSIKTKGLKLKRSRPANLDREAFSLDDMRVLFQNAARYRTKKPAKWWITVACAFLGCRVEELAQAHIMGDFKIDAETGAMVFSISELAADVDDDGQISPAKSVKTLAGWRKVPVHPALVEAGFIQFLRDEAAAGNRTPFQRQWTAFREPRTGAVVHSHAAVKWGGRELKKLRASGSITGNKTYFHSMRHMFVTLLAKAGVSEEWRAGLAGQAHGGVNAQVYNKAREDASATLPLLVGGLAPLERVFRDVLGGK